MDRASLLAGFVWIRMDVNGFAWPCLLGLNGFWMDRARVLIGFERRCMDFERTLDGYSLNHAGTWILNEFACKRIHNHLNLRSLENHSPPFKFIYDSRTFHSTSIQSPSKIHTHSLVIKLHRNSLEMIQTNWNALSSTVWH